MAGLWTYGSGTASELTALLNREKRTPISPKTVLTGLTRLEQKGLVRHTKEGRHFRFFPALSEEEVAVKYIGEEIGDIIDDFGDLAVAVFVERLGTVPGRLDHLRRLLEVGNEGSVT
jgi:BlaI family transcriptional regulator, penicillinase repressor